MKTNQVINPTLTQSVFWSGDFGKAYTKRNRKSLKEMENFYKAKFGVTRRCMNEEFLENINKDMPILEVGCNIGNQLAVLSNMGFTNLFGIELSDYALEIAKRQNETKGISFIRGNVFDMPFKNNSFTLVFTSGVLIHIHPNDILRAMGEIYRCTSTYIWGFEYYADTYQEVVYRGQKNLLWKTDFVKIYKEAFPDLILVKEKKYTYLDDNNLIDQMFLFKKAG